jgi:hypothetical protein
MRIHDRVVYLADCFKMGGRCPGNWVVSLRRGEHVPKVRAHDVLTPISGSKDSIPGSNQEESKKKGYIVYKINVHVV